LSPPAGGRASAIRGLARGVAARDAVFSSDELPYGAAVAIVELVDIVPLEKVRGDPFASGPLCWTVENLRPIERIVMSGG
jgi:hypothetical protein